MSSFLKSVFGGSTATQQSQAGSAPVDLTPEPFKNLRDPLSTALQGYLSQGGTPEYTGPTSAPITAPEQNILTQLQGATTPDNSRSTYLADVLSGKYLPGSPGSNPFLDAAIKAAQRPTLEGLTETLSRALPGRFTQAGQFIQPNTTNQGGSSAFDRAAAIATRGAANALGDIATNIGYNAYGQERQAQQQAVPLSQAEVQTTIGNLQAQALPRLIQQLGIDNALQLFSQRTQSLLQLLQTISGVSAPVIGNVASSSASGNSSTERGIIPGLFPGGIAPGAGK